MAPNTDNRRLKGTNVLGYMGVNPSTPSNLYTYTYEPTSDDYTSVSIGDFWLVIDPTANPAPSPILFMLGDLDGMSATWVQLYPATGTGILEIVTNMGTAIQAAQTIFILGTAQITTTGSGNTVSMALDNGTNGQFLIGGGTSPNWSLVTSLGNTVTITPGANSLNLETNFSPVAGTFAGNTGTAMPVSGAVNIYGDANILTTTGSGNTVTLQYKQGTNGQIPIAATGGPTKYGSITSLDNSITVTNGPNSINLSTAANPQIAFFYYQATNFAKPPAQVTYYLGKSVILTKLFDVGNNVYPGNGSGGNGRSGEAYFTAPINGIYMIGACITYSANSASTFLRISGEDFFLRVPSVGTDPWWNCVTVEMSAGDIATCGYGEYGGYPFNQTIDGASGSPYYYTYFWGFILNKI